MKENELFKRQFILTRKRLEVLHAWKKINISPSLFLYSHPTLEVEQVKNEENNFTITLIGYIINPYKPSQNNQQVLIDLKENSDSFNSLQENTYHLSGRWAIIYISKNETKIFNDPCGSRQIFYINNNGSIHCGSQPNILAKSLGIQKDINPLIEDFIESEAYKKSENFWIGDGTQYQNIKHLLPNHFLDIKNYKVSRFWVNKEKKTNENLDEVVNEIIPLLKGAIEGLIYRYNSMLAVTAGVDSRVLLAASKNVKNKLKFYVSTHNHLAADHRDIVIPLELSKQVGFEFEVIDNIPPLRQVFLNKLKTNVGIGRNIPKIRTTQYHFDNSNKVNISGNGSGIVNFFYGDKNTSEISAEYIANLIGYKKNEYVEESIQKWLNTAIPFVEENNYEITNLLYWEQRMGNWGALYQAELDIAIEEFSPYNNRKLIMLLTSVNKKFRGGPKFLIQKEIIKRLWPELLSIPFNPKTFKEKSISFLGSLIPDKIKIKIRSYF